eukprot:711695-Amphidinium_carterae.6
MPSQKGSTLNKTARICRVSRFERGEWGLAEAMKHAPSSKCNEVHWLPIIEGFVTIRYHGVQGSVHIDSLGETMTSTLPTTHRMLAKTMQWTSFPLTINAGFRLFHLMKEIRSKRHMQWYRLAFDVYCKCSQGPNM